MIITFEELKSNRQKLKELQTLLKKAGFYLGEIDGIWGPKTDGAIEQAAKALYLNTYETKKIGNTFITFLKKYLKENIGLVHPVKPEYRELTEAQIAKVAKDLNVSVAHLKAVIEVEAAGSGFFNSGNVKILFEAHWFSKLTNNRYDGSYPDISSRRWNRKLYVGGEYEHTRLRKAMKLDKLAALQSASWGAFQIMGFNYRKCGYATVVDFIKSQHTAIGQLEAVVGFLKTTKLDRALRSNNWARFAKGYNGPSYHVNKYDVKLAQAYQKFA